MHRITDKLHHKHAQPEPTPAVHTINPTTQTSLEKTYVSNSQGALLHTQQAHTLTQQGPVHTTSWVQQQQVPVQTTSFVQQVPVQNTFVHQVPVQTTLIQQAPIQTTSFSTQQYSQNIETVRVHTLAPVVQTRVRPAIVEETTRIDTVTQIQPIVHREIEQTQVHLLEKHIYETVPSSGPTMITNQAIVEETVRPRIMEQIQPIVHREVAAPFVERVEEHITERVVQPTTTSKQVFSENRSLTIEEASARGFTAAALPAVSTAQVVHTTTAQAVMETRTRGAIVEQTTRAEKITQIQPIIHREIDAPELHLIEKHSYENVRSTGPGLITNQAIVQETVTPHIIEQIQPIVHRSVPAPFVEKVEQHSTEHVVAPTQTSKQVFSEQRTAAPVQIAQQHAVGAPTVHHTEAAAIVENRTRAAIVEQTTRAEKITQVQPIIHREIDAPEVHVIEKHSYETVRSSGPGIITNQAIVQETVTPHIIEQIQPIVHRSVPAPFVEKVEQHTTEHVVAPTQTSKQVLSEQRTAAPVQISQQHVIGAPTVHQHEAAATIENRTRAAIVEQTTRAEKITQVQPIIHREIDAPEVHVIEKHSYETVRSSGPGIITNQAIVQETVTPHIIEQIQPIVHRSVPAPFVEKVEQHTTEHVVAPTQTSKQVLSEQRTAAPVQIAQQHAIGAPTVHHTEAAAIVENRTRAAIVEQTTRAEKITQVQPIIHREIDAPELHLIEKHSYENVRSSGPGVITNQAIVQETVTPHIIEQIQPIVHRSVPAPFVEKVEQHTTEHVVAPTQTSKQVFSEQRTAAPVQIAQQHAIGAATVHHTEAAATVENRTRAAILQQTSRPEKITQVQPIIHREIDAPEVHVIEKHSYERVASTGPSTITRGAIVEETITPTIIEEIQPIIHRNVAQTVVERVEQHTTEHIVAPTQTSKQVFSEQRTAAAVPLPAAMMAQRSTVPTVHSSTAQTVTESVTRPALVEQTTRAEKITQVQPIIHREIDAPEVHVIEKHLYERVPSQGPSVITNQTIVQETIRPKIVEEIQPVLHRNVPVSVVERVEQHTTEHIVQPTVSTKQVFVEKHATEHMMMPAVAAGGPLPLSSSTHTTTTTTTTNTNKGAAVGGLLPSGTQTTTTTTTNNATPVVEQEKHGLRRFF